MSEAVTAFTEAPPEERLDFSAAFTSNIGSNGQPGAHAGAAFTRLLADWNQLLGDPNDDWVFDGATLASRAWNLVQNDPHARALLECVILGILGAGNDLEFRSLFEQVDDGTEDETTDDERADRLAIQNAIARASMGTQLDAGDALARRELLAQLVASMVVSGDGYAVRVWKPRANAFQATRWRVVDAARVSNPDGAPDSAVMYQGHELDADGVVVAIWVRDRHPFAMRALDQKPTWSRIPVYAEDGSRVVLHLFRALRPGQIRGFSWYAPLLVISQHLGRLFESFVIAKRAAANAPIVVKADNIEEVKAAMKAGSYLGPNFKWRPGQIAITSRDNDVLFPTLQFNGSDYQAFIDAHLRVLTAVFGYPFQYVLQQLTEANLASAQVALDQVDKVNTALQDLVIQQAVLAIDEGIIREEIARGRLELPTDDMAVIMRGVYRRPRRPDANKSRTREAAQKFLEMGGSFSTAFAEMGYDFEDETNRLAENLAYLRAKGIPEGLIAQRLAAYPTFQPGGLSKPGAPAGGQGDQGDQAKPGAAPQKGAA